MRPLGLYVFSFSFFYGVPLWLSSFMAFLYVVRSCLLLRSAARGEVLQYLTRSALSRRRQKAAV